MVICLRGKKRRFYSQHDNPIDIFKTLFSIHVSTIENLIAFARALGKGYYSKRDAKL